MKLNFSIQKAMDSFVSVWKRFPVTAVLAVVGTVSGLVLIGNPDNQLAGRLLLTAVLFFPVSTGVQDMQKQNYPAWVKVGSNVVGLLLLVGFFLFYSRLDEFLRSDFIRYVMWFGFAVVFMSVSPFLRKFLENSFEYWNYVKHIVSAIAVSFVYSALIFAGLSIALLAVNELFTLNLPQELWAQLWTIIVGLLSTTIFLNKYSKVTETYNLEEFPRELRVAGGGIALGLVCLYFLILYSYTLKIVFTNEWPKGIISTLIVGFSTLGMITFVLLYPLSQQENKYRKIFNVLFISFIPQAVVLFYAVSLRLKDYGLTENRYLLIAFGIWLILVSLYFLVSKTKSLKVIPLSLGVFLILASAGPVSAFSLSGRDQFNRLKELLVSNNILINNKLTKGPHNIDSAVSGKIYDALIYFNNYHGLDSVSKFLPEDRKEQNSLGQITDFLGLSYEPDMVNAEYVSFYTKKDTPRVLGVDEYDYLVEDFAEVKSEADVYGFRIDGIEQRYDVFKNGSVISQIELAGFIENLRNKYAQGGSNSFAVDEMSMHYEDDKLEVKIYFDYITLIDQKLEVKDRKLLRIK